MEAFATFELGFSAHEFWRVICPAQLFARMEMYERRRDREDARAALMPYIYRNMNRGKEQELVPFEDFLPQYKPEVTAPADAQALIDARAEAMKAQFIALAQRMKQQRKSTDG